MVSESHYSQIAGPHKTEGVGIGYTPPLCTPERSFGALKAAL
jgi:hypothetical protein